MKCLVKSREHNFIISGKFSKRKLLYSEYILGSWDQEISIWDPRQRRRVVSRPQNERVYAMDCVENTLVVGTAQRKILIWDLRNWGMFLIIFEQFYGVFSRRMPTKTRIKSEISNTSNQMLPKWNRICHFIN